MSIVFAFLVVGFVIAIPILLLSLIIKAIRKKPVKKTAWSILGCFVGMIVSAMIFSAIDPQINCEHEFAVIENIDATCNSEGKIVKQCPKCSKETKETIPMKAHKWKTSDCENPKICELCGETEGEKGGHNWKEATCIAPKTCVICNKTEGTTSNHLWTEASCTLPKTCSVCGLTEGDALNANKMHTWADASCILPKTCSVCGSTEGEPNESHVWKKATCFAPKTCEICGAVEGTKNEHVLGEWKVVDEGTFEKQGTKQQRCTECKVIINTEKFDSPYKLAADAVKEVATKYSATTGQLEVIIGDEDNSIVITSAVYCENNEQVVNNILSEISEKLQNIDIKSSCLFVFGDIADGTDGECLAMGSIESNGEYKVSSMSIDFKTERNIWISGQFSAWDGSHTVLKNLIKNNLNDENSFKHIETTYIDVSTEDKKKEVNNILKKSGYSQRVDVGDLFVMTEFSAKNAFNATIKNTAFGIVDYSADLVTLIGIE